MGAAFCEIHFYVKVFQKRNLIFCFFIQIFSYSFLLFGRSQMHDMPPCERPHLLISSGDWMRCWYFDWPCCERPLAETTPGHSKRYPNYIVYFVQPMYIFITPMFLYCENWYKSFLDNFWIIFSKDKMSEDAFSIISKSIVNMSKF